MAQKKGKEYPKTGGIKVIQLQEGHKVWTKKVGSSPTKILTLHGGPGATHEYFECFEDYLPRKKIEYYYYDQLGSFYSDQPKDEKLWTIERFREEVDQVRESLGLDKFYLLGHSWGGMLGIEYALKYQSHLKGLIISNMTASIPSYVAYVNKLRRKLPFETRRTLEKYEAKLDYAAPEYQDIIFNHIYKQHICRVEPWPDPVNRAFKNMNQQVYNYMQGPNEFLVTGTFKDWDRWGDLQRIKVPTLLIGSKYDEMNPRDIRKMGTLIPNSRVRICQNGSHMDMYDDQEYYMNSLIRFIKDVENNRFK
jgi:proline iminopeptidase